MRRVFKSPVGFKLSRSGWFYGDVQVYNTIYPGTFSSTFVISPRGNSFSLLNCLLNPTGWSNDHHCRGVVDTYINNVLFKINYMRMITQWSIQKQVRGHDCKVLLFSWVTIVFPWVCDIVSVLYCTRSLNRSFFIDVITLFEIWVAEKKVRF